MKRKMKYAILVGCGVLAVLLIVFLIVWNANQNRDDPAGEQSQSRETAGNATEEAAKPEDPDNSPADEETDGKGETESGLPADSTPGNPSDPSDPPQTPENTTDKPADEVTAEPEKETASAMPVPLLFEEYQALSGEQQLAYFRSFSSPEEFFLWYNAAVADFEERNPGVEISPDGMLPAP